MHVHVHVHVHVYLHMHIYKHCTRIHTFVFDELCVPFYIYMYIYMYLPLLCVHIHVCALVTYTHFLFTWRESKPLRLCVLLSMLLGSVYLSTVLLLAHPCDMYLCLLSSASLILLLQAGSSCYTLQFLSGWYGTAEVQTLEWDSCRSDLCRGHNQDLAIGSWGEYNISCMVQTGPCHQLSLSPIVND